MGRFIKMFIVIIMPCIVAILCLRLAFNENHNALFSLNDITDYFDNDEYDMAQDTLDFADDVKKYFDAFKPRSIDAYYYGRQYGYYTPVRISANNDASTDTIKFMSSTMDPPEEVDFPYYHDVLRIYAEEKAVQMSNGMYVIYTYSNWDSNWFDAFGNAIIAPFTLMVSFIIMFGGYAVNLSADVLHYVGVIPYIISVE